MDSFVRWFANRSTSFYLILDHMMVDLVAVNTNYGFSLCKGTMNVIHVYVAVISRIWMAFTCYTVSYNNVTNKIKSKNEHLRFHQTVEMITLYFWVIGIKCSYRLFIPIVQLLTFEFSGRSFFVQITHIVSFHQFARANDCI